MSEPIHALTVWQPWATLIVARWKPFEFRQWAAPARIVGQRIAIHAGAREPRRDEIAELLDRMNRQRSRIDEAAHDFLEQAHLSPALLPLSSVLGTAVLGTPRLAASLFAGQLDPNDSGRVDHAMWAWPMLSVERFDIPVPARGAQGFWRWSRPDE